MLLDDHFFFLVHSCFICFLAPLLNLRHQNEQRRQLLTFDTVIWVETALSYRGIGNFYVPTSCMDPTEGNVYFVFGKCTHFPLTTEDVSDDEYNIDIDVIEVCRIFLILGYISYSNCF